MIFALFKTNLSIRRDCSYIVFSLQENISSKAVQERGFNFDDDRLMRGAWRNEPNPDVCKVNMTLLMHSMFILAIQFLVFALHRETNILCISLSYHSTKQKGCISIFQSITKVVNAIQCITAQLRYHYLMMH